MQPTKQQVDVAIRHLQAGRGSATMTGGASGGISVAYANDDGMVRVIEIEADQDEREDLLRRIAHLGANQISRHRTEVV